MKIVHQLTKKLTGLLASGAIMVLAMGASPGQAGINIQIGMSKGDIIRILSKKGYSQIQVHDKGFKTGKAYACKDGLKYNVKVDYKGRIKGVVKIGSCRNQVTEKQVRRNLEANGYTRVVIDEQNSNYVIIGCKGRQRTRLIISLQGELVQRKNIGNCKDVLAPTDVRQVLRKEGFNRIKFTDRQLPRYVAEACYDRDKLELVINRFGEVKNQRRIGRCNPPIDGRNLAEVMRKKGYDRIFVINENPPRYQVEACADSTRYEITLNKYGTITDRQRIGDCNPIVDKKQIAQLLRQEGFTRIDIKQRQNGNFRISACFDGYQKRIKLNRFGELLEEVDGQQCASRSITEISDSLSGRGFKRAKFYAEACRQGRRIRIELNQFGDQIGRERVGNC